MENKQFQENKDYGKLILLFILSVAFVLRIYNLCFDGLWTDEMISVYASNPFVSLRRMYDVLHFWDQTPPLYPLMFWLWLKIVGFTEFNARLFSVLGGMLGLYAMYFLIKEIYTKNIALLMTFLLAITPYHIYFSRETRSYIWSLLITTLVLYFFVKQLKHYSKSYTRFLFIVCGGMLMQISYFSFFVHAGLVSVLLFAYFTKKANVNIKNWLVDYICVGICFLPWLLQFIRILGYHNGNNGSSPHPSYIIDLLSVFSAVNAGGYLLAAAYILALLGFAYVSFYHKKPFQQSVYWYIFILLFSCVYTLMYVKSATGRNILNGFMFSYVIVLLPAFCVILAGIFSQLDKKIIALFLVVFVASNAYNHDRWLKNGYYKKRSEPYREMSAFISKSSYAKAQILCTCTYIQEFYYYKLNMDKQLVDLSEMDKKIDMKNTQYLWVIDTYDLQANDILKEVQKRHAYIIKESRQFKGVTGNIIFNAYLLEFTNPVQ